MDQASSIDIFLAEAESFIGTKWRHKGRSRFGLDCLGLVVLSASAAGRKMRDRLNYGREPWRDGLDREMVEHFGAPIPIEEMRPGDIVTMRGIGQPGPGHVGIVAHGPGYLTLIHSYNADAQCCVARCRIDEHWLARIHAVYRPFP